MLDGEKCLIQAIINDEGIRIKNLFCRSCGTRDMSFKAYHISRILIDLSGDSTFHIARDDPDLQNSHLQEESYPDDLG